MGRYFDSGPAVPFQKFAKSPGFQAKDWQNSTLPLLGLFTVRYHHLLSMLPR